LEGEVLTQVFKRVAKQDGHKATITSKDFENILLSSFSARIVGELPMEIKKKSRQPRRRKSLLPRIHRLLQRPHEL